MTSSQPLERTNPLAFAMMNDSLTMACIQIDMITLGQDLAVLCALCSAPRNYINPQTHENKIETAITILNRGNILVARTQLHQERLYAKMRNIVATILSAGEPITIQPATSLQEIHK